MKGVLFISILIMPARALAQAQVSIDGGYLTQKFHVNRKDAGVEWKYAGGYYAGVSATLQRRDTARGASPLGAVVSLSWNSTKIEAGGASVKSPDLNYARLSAGVNLFEPVGDKASAFMRITADLNVPTNNGYKVWAGVTPTLGLGYRGVLLTVGYQVGLTKVSKLGSYADNFSRAIQVGVSVFPGRIAR